MKTGHPVLSAVELEQLPSFQVFLRPEMCGANSFHPSPPIAVGSSCVDVIPGDVIREVVEFGSQFRLQCRRHQDHLYGHAL